VSPRHDSQRWPSDAVKRAISFAKANDIHRTHTTFELLADDVVLLDMCRSDEGTFEIAFNEPIGGNVITWDDLQDLIGKGTGNGGG
jgi:hypothetical protein